MVWEHEIQDKFYQVIPACKRKAYAPYYLGLRKNILNLISQEFTGEVKLNWYQCIFLGDREKIREYECALNTTECYVTHYMFLND